MLLAIDVGNTHTVAGMYDGAHLIAEWRLSSLVPRTADETWAIIRNLCADRGIDPHSISEAGVSSVVPEITAVCASMIREYLGIEPVVVSASLDLGIRILYDDPASVGADRLCNAIAGYRKYGGPLIVIDFGTATTFDVVDRDGNYLGGAITIGLETAAQELHRKTARLPRVELRFPDCVIGKNTEASMQSGLMYGAVDAVEGMVKRIRGALGEDSRVIATGGLSGVIASHTAIIGACEPSLVLEGIRLVCDRCRQTPRR